MASTATPTRDSSAAFPDSHPARVFHWSIAVLTLGGLGFALEANPPQVDVWEVGVWVLASLCADLMYVRLGRGVSVSMSLPVLLAAALLFPPSLAALIAFLGSLDPRDIRGLTPLERMLFNRSQIALSAASASLVIHVLTPGFWGWPLVILACAAGFVADFIVNVALVGWSTVLSGRAQWGELWGGLWGGEPVASLGLYASSCVIAPLLALIYKDWGPLALLACTSLLLPARVALSRIQSLNAAGQLVRIRDAEIASANASALSERRAERLTLAGDLHDEVLPALFRVHLMGEVLRQDLASGRLLDLDDDLPDLLDATSTAQDAVRRVVGNLRGSRAAIGSVSRAIRGHAEQLEGDGRPRIELSLCEFEGSDQAGLALVQVAKEALVNGSKYSDADRIVVSLWTGEGWAELTVSDDGRGFDLGAVDGSCHFGLQLMKERVAAIGGELSVETAPGEGTKICARVPLDSPQ
jgi:signal transduction histidine kinase